MSDEQQRYECRAPRSGEYFRVNPDPEYRRVVALTRDEKGVPFLIAPHMVADIERLCPERVERCMMFTAQNEKREIFLWPVKLPVADDHPAYAAMYDWVYLTGMH